LIRALEVYFQTGKPLTLHFADTVSPLPADVTVTAMALRMDASALAERLARRVDAQFRAGLLDEVNGLLARGVPRTARPFGGLVYRQMIEHIEGVRDLRATRDLIVQENRRYARRQLIWFRKEPNLTWFDGPGEMGDVQASVLGWLAERGLLIDGGPAAHG
jgi:tRNA dimethylallyltransferase